MPVDATPLLNSEGNVDVQIGGPGQSAWKYLSSCASMDGPSIPKGDTELRYCQDSQQAGKFVVSNKIRRAADQASGNLMTKLSKINFLDNLDCPFSLRARYARCGTREDPTNIDPLAITFCTVDLTSEDYDALVGLSADDDEEIMITSPWTAIAKYTTELVVGSRAGGSATNVGDQPINDWAICDTPQCPGLCGVLRDGCSIFYGVTDTDAAPYAAPNIIQGIEDVLTGTITWDVDPVLGINGNIENVECAGSRVIVTSNADSVVAYNETYEDSGFLDQDAWNVITLTHAPTANPNALFARTTQEVWIAADDGYVAKSTDGAATWSYVQVDADSTQLNAITAFDQDLVYVVGNNGRMYRSTDGGTTWTNITEVATTAANILDVEVPPGREREVYISTNSAEIFKSVNQGATFAIMAFTGDGAGTIPSIAFCGPCGGDVLWILQNDSGPRGRILRDLSGGFGGTDVREEVGYTAIISAGVQLNALECCDINTAWAVGELSGGYPVIIKVA